MPKQPVFGDNLPKIVAVLKPQDRMLFGEILERAWSLVAAVDRVSQPIQDRRHVVVQAGVREALRTRQALGSRYPFANDGISVFANKRTERIHRVLETWCRLARECLA